MKSKNNPPKDLQNLTIAALRAQGKSTREIAKKVHISHVQVANKLKDNDVKTKLEGFIKYYVSYGDEVKQKFMELVLSDNADVKQKAISEYHKVTGISPSHTPSIFIGNLYQDNRQQIISTDVLTLLGKHLGDKQDVIDVKPLELDKVRLSKGEGDK